MENNTANFKVKFIVVWLTVDKRLYFNGRIPEEKLLKKDPWNYNKCFLKEEQYAFEYDSKEDALTMLNRYVENPLIASSVKGNMYRIEEVYVAKR